ncbi:MAG: hypothetical protein JXB32_15800 [Deltaproteobacteria bacterium]|nr:hypothetical protein [Deltaproteobacteria bacterium]
MRGRTTRGGAVGAGRTTDGGRWLAATVPAPAWAVLLSLGIAQLAAAQPATEADPTVETEPGTGEGAVVGTEPATGAVGDPETEVGAAGEPGTPELPGQADATGTAVEPETAVEPGTQEQPGTVGETGTAVQPAAGAEAETVADAEAVVEVDAAVEPESAVEVGAAAGPEATAQAEPAASGGEADQGAVPDWANVEVGARLYTMWRLTDDLEDPGNEFALNSMRVQAEWEPVDWARAVLELEAEQLVQGGSAEGLLRDAYVELSPFRWLEVRAGQFKRAFSRLELTPRRNLRTIDRGLQNRWVVGRLGYGDRDIGVGLSGRLWKAANLDYAVGVFNGRGAGMLESAGQGFKDFSARLDARPVDWLSVGLSFSLNTLEPQDLPYLVDPAIFAEVDDLVRYPGGYDESDFRDEHEWMVGTTWMTGADVVFRAAGLRVLAEAAFGENWWFEGAPLTSAVTLVAWYEIELLEEWGLGLEPVFRGELALPRIEWLDQRMWRAVVGVNLLLGRYVRLMVDGEFTRVEGPQPDTVRRGGLWPGEWPGGWENVNCLRVQLALDV